MPLGENVSASDLLNLSTMLKKNGYSGDISNVPPAIIDAFPELSQHYEIEDYRGGAEYIYSAEKLFVLSGKKLRKKKNHVSQFLRKYPDYQVRPLDSTVRKDCLSMVNTMLDKNSDVSESIREETIVLTKALKSFAIIPLQGIAIYVENRLVCFSIYSRINQDVYTVHFEKADYAYSGAAQIINWETAKALKDTCRYINREQDLGLSGLRKAKLSYDPEFIYPATFLTFRTQL